MTHPVTTGTRTAGVAGFPGPTTPTRRLFHGTDWAATPLGEPGSWSPTLHAAVSTTLTSKFPMLLMLGDDLTMVYNDAYAPMLGDRHPAAMGQPMTAVWHDVWPSIGPMIDAVRDEVDGNHFEDLMLVMTRHGFAEETYFTFSYSPLVDPDGTVVGLLDTAIETTGRVLAARRLGTLQQLGQVGTRRHDSLGEAVASMASVLAENRADLPLAGFYLLDDVEDPSADLRRLGGHGTPDGDRPGEEARRWLREVLASGVRTVAGVAGTWTGLDPAPAEVGGGDVRTVVALPLLTPGRADPIGVLVLGVSPHLVLDEDYHLFLDALAAQIGRTLGDTVVHLGERDSALATRAMSEALQRSMLTEPVRPDHLDVVTRYVPAAVEAEIGGDWYDAFVDGRGASWLVVGDVAGHDQAAAAVMGQVRNLLRGIAFTGQESPAVVLDALDRAMDSLGVSGLTTLVVARVDQHDGSSGSGRRVRWSNAGHPPPLLFDTTGAVRVLATRPEPLLGAVAGTPRTDHELSLPAGAGLLLYTDGLVERRGSDLDAGTRWLVDAVAATVPAELGVLCDTLLAEVVGHAADDIALLAVVARPKG